MTRKQALIFTPGMIAVTKRGNRIAIWPNESDDDGCFTGQRLESGATIETVRVHNVSSFWDHKHVTHIETATDADKALSIISLSMNPTAQVKG